jgi:hypothetical protein
MYTMYSTSGAALIWWTDTSLPVIVKEGKNGKVPL